MADKYVNKDEARKSLSTIVLSIQGGDGDVCVGTSEETALCAFVSLKNFRKEGDDVYPNEIEDVDLDVLRKHWSSKRKLVEYGGRYLRVMKNAKPAVYLVPTYKAHERNIEPLEKMFEDRFKAREKETQKQSDLAKAILKIDARLSRFEEEIALVSQRISTISDLCPTEEDSKEFRKLLGVGREIVNEWRRREGHVLAT